MIYRNGLKPESFIAAIEGTIARDSHGRPSAESLTREAIESAEGVIYLAAGYWRAVPIWDERDQLAGVRLINPDRTPAECRMVEQGIAILCHLTYQAG